MSNPIIETDLAEILKKLDSRFDKLENKIDTEIRQGLKSLGDRLSKLELGQEEIKGEIKVIKTDQINIKEQVGEIKGSQKAQLWSLIVILATALLGILVAAGKILFFASTA